MSDVSNDNDYLPTLAEQLTIRFYQWEKRGRGWKVWSEPVDLEPAYTPFFHRLPELHAPIDDGRKPGLFDLLGDKIRKLFTGTGAPEPAVDDETDDFDPHPAAFVDDLEIEEITVSLFPDEKIAVESAEQFLLGLSGCAFPLSYEILAAGDHTQLQFASRQRDTNLVTQQLRACFPETVLGQGKDVLKSSWNREKPTVVVDFGLSGEFMRPLRTFRRFDPDPLAGIIGAMEGVEKGELGLLQVLFEPAQHLWVEDVLRAVSDGEGRSFFTDCPEMLSLAREKVQRPLFAAVLRVVGQGRTRSRAWQIVRALGAGLKQLDNPHSNELIPLDNENDDNEDEDNEDDDEGYSE